MKRSTLILLALTLAAVGCTIIYATRSTVGTHDGDIQTGTNRATKIQIKP